MSIGLSVFGFDENEHKWRAIWLHSTIHNIRSPIWWVITKVIYKLFAITYWEPPGRWSHLEKLIWQSPNLTNHYITFYFTSVKFPMWWSQTLCNDTHSDLTSLINGKYVFGPCQIFGKFELTFSIIIWSENKIYCSYLSWS